jgi:hypothetical protein
MSWWTTTWVRPFLSTRLGIAYSRERARRLLHALGCRPRRLRHRHLKAKPAAQAAFRAELEQRVDAWPEDWELLFVDEAAVRRHPTWTAQGCLAEEVPEVPTGDEHTKRHGYGAVAPLTGGPHDPSSAELGKGEFAPFLPHLLVDHPGTRLLVIHDRGEQHTGAAVEAVVRGAQGRLVLQAQPAYSPELHPQERIWTWLRRVVMHNHWVATLKE